MQPSTDDQVVAVVGGQAITKHDYNSALEKQSGKAVLNKLVYSALVRQAAKKANVLPTDGDVETRIADLARRNPQAVVQANDPLTGRDFREDIRTDMALENLRIQSVAVSEDEVATFYEGNQRLFTLPGQAETTIVITFSKEDTDVAETLLRQDISPQEIAARPRLHVAGTNGYTLDMDRQLPAFREHVGKTVLAMKPGQIQTFATNASYFTVKVKRVKDAYTPPLSQIKEQVTRQVKLSKAVTSHKQIALLYEASPPQFGDQRHQAYFTDLHTISEAR